MASDDTDPPLFIEDLITHGQVLSIRAPNLHYSLCTGLVSTRFENDRLSVLRCSLCGAVLIRDESFIVVWVELKSS